MTRALVGIALGLIARLWLATLRVRVFVHRDLTRYRDVPWVLALWHGQVLPLLAYKRRRKTVALVSLSSDGDLLAWAFTVLDVSVERGSSTRGGSAGFSKIVTRLGEVGCDGAFAVDGPKGPRHVVRPGALAAARLSRGVLVPLAAECEQKWVLRTWDRFEIPAPFSRVCVVIGRPVCPAKMAHRDGIRAVAVALDATHAAATAMLRSTEPPARRSAWLPDTERVHTNA